MYGHILNELLLRIFTNLSNNVRVDDKQDFAKITKFIWRSRIILTLSLVWWTIAGCAGGAVSIVLRRRFCSCNTLHNHSVA